MHVGIIGVGLMGHGIARNVLKHGGFTLGFLDHPGNQPTAEILELGGRSCATIAEVVNSADAVILCVTGSPQVEALVAGEGGVAAHLLRGAVVIDCSTSLPETTLRMSERVSQAGGGYLDAPMTRTAKHAHDGTLNLLVGGAVDTLEAVRPLLDCFADNVDHVGSLGDGHRLKLLHNFVSLGFATLLAEAAAQAADTGVDPNVFVEVLAAGGGASVALDRLAPFIREGSREGLPFVVSNARKDIDYYRAMSQASGARTTVADGVSRALSTVIDEGHGNAFVPELVRLFSNEGGR